MSEQEPLRETEAKAEAQPSTEATAAPTTADARRLPVLSVDSNISSAAVVRDDWYFVCEAKELERGQSLCTSLWDQPIVVFRDGSGELGALLDRCPHRNVPLSGGEVEAEGLRCPYHGWRFGRDGHCLEIPGLVDEPDAIARRAGAFAVTQRQGLVWIWGEAGAEPTRAPHELPHLGAPGYTSAVQSFEVDATLHAVAENTLDVPHTAYLHGGLFREAGRNAEIEVIVRRYHDRVEAQYVGEPRPSGLVGKVLAPGGGEITHVDRFWLPAVCEVDYALGDSSHINVRSLLTPLGMERTRLTAITCVRLPVPAFVVKPVLLPLARRIFAQDAKILRAQKDSIARFGGERFVSTELDALGPEILRLLRAAERGDRGVKRTPSEHRFKMRI